MSPSGSFLAPEAYFVGMSVRFIPTNTNTGASTINVDGLGVKNIKLASGVDPDLNHIISGVLVSLYYDGTDFIIKQSFQPLYYLDKKRIEVQSDINVDTTSYEPILDLVHNGPNYPNSVWPKELCGPGKVQFTVRSRSAVSSAKEISIQINQDSTPVFQSGTINFGDAGGSSTYLRRFASINDMSSGNVLNVDLTTTDIFPINTNTGGLVISAKRLDGNLANDLFIDYIDFYLFP